MELNRIYLGDCLGVLGGMPDGSVDCCVTSPPYYGLRDYGHDGQIGLEETPEAFVQKLVEVFREVKRVLKDEGTLWLNLGDSYSSHKDCKSIGQTLAKGTSRETAHEMELGKSRVRDTKMLKSQGLKNKDLIGIPWMVAFALRADGWYLRQDIIWSKPNPMPESVTDRCTKSHEYIFLLSKSQKYYYDHEAIFEAANYDGRKDTVMKGSPKYTGDYYPGNQVQTVAARGHERWPNQVDGLPGRNKRSVWTVTTKPFKEAHFATFPEALIVPCIKAGCPEGGVVLDPFGGAGTTAVVAHKLKRDWVLIELNEKYADIATKRLKPFVTQFRMF